MALRAPVARLAFALTAWSERSRLMRAVQEATPAVWGVILQFPFHAGIAGVITATHLNERVAGAFVRLSTPRTYPPLVAIYSALLGVFVPSGGSKWVIEANLVQPFWMRPTLGLFRLGARDVMGYTLVVFLVLVPVVLPLVTVLGTTLGYPF